ncbi:ribosomal protein L29 (plastid) [Cryptomonas paramecium]|uniref:Ribosomal protein L29 n=1 Tax=Cryptomonas paramaecium TaxID=2898 RepID=D2ISA2_9CRYP|nr:ribosomal protein L29 [Cryptomonas paramecium]ACT46794.1 ribosomal protein L29 [Cryptomonas paramecium]BDA98001.1 ribosomal protein L29 [Cryptomonas paramecium]
MLFTDFKDLQKLTDEMIYFELLSVKKDLFNLRSNKITRKSLKPHLFKVNKRRVAQLLTLLSKRALSY